MKNTIHELYYEQDIPHPINEVYAFFSNEKNLELITPPWLRFKVIGKSTPAITKGTLIDYNLKLYGIPLRWKSLITDLQHNQSFVDLQLKGPYRIWHHFHHFEDLGRTTRMIDHVFYQIPYYPIIHSFIGNWVKKKLEMIFSFRSKKIAEFFPKTPALEKATIQYLSE